MTDTTPRLALPELAAAQSQKHVTLNEALIKLDALVDLYLLGQYIVTPPTSPSDGDTYLTGASCTGAWSGYDYKIAACIDGGWRFYTPFNGLRAYVASTGSAIMYVGGSWLDVSSSSAFNAAETTIASAATCDIGSLATQCAYVAGTTAITSFGTGTNKLRFVRFAGALTLTHNATSLILLGGASRTTAANDTGVYVSDASGNWREREYFRAANDPGKTPAVLGNSGQLTVTGQPLFTAHLNATVSNVTGSGTDDTILFNATIINRGTVYNTSNGKFSAPVAGNYMFSGSVLATGLSSSHSNGMNPYVCMRSDGYAGMILGSPVVPLSANDTVEFQIHIGTGTKTVGLFGGALTTGLNSFFSGFLLAG